jgi:hypothetical protein
MNFSESHPNTQPKLAQMLCAMSRISPERSGKPPNAAGKNRSLSLPYCKSYISLFLLTPFDRQLGFTHIFHDRFPFCHTLIMGHLQLLQRDLCGFIEPFWGKGKVTLHFSSK